MVDRHSRFLAATLLGLAVLGCNPAGPTAAPSAPSATASPASSSPAASVPPVTAAPTAVASPSPGATGAAGAPPCEAADLKASHGLVEATADSRLTEVVLSAALACSIDSFPPIRLIDASGATLIDAPSLGLGTLDLSPDAAYTSEVRLAGWCGAEPPFPLTLVLVIDGSPLSVTGSSFPDDGDLPPCTGSGPATLEASAWVPAP